MEKLDYETPQRPRISDRWGRMSASLAGASAACPIFGIAVSQFDMVIANDITFWGGRLLRAGRNWLWRNVMPGA